MHSTEHAKKKWMMNAGEMQRTLINMRQLEDPVSRAINRYGRCDPEVEGIVNYPLQDGERKWQQAINISTTE